MSGLLDKAKRMVFEDTEEKKPAPPLPTFAHSVATVSSALQTATPLSVVDGSVYQKLKEKTDFSNTAVGQTIQKYLVPLAKIPLDEQSKFKAALAQARAIEHLTDDQILREFDQLAAVLQTEANGFQNSAHQFEVMSVTGGEAQLKELEQKIVEKQTELGQLLEKKKRDQAEVAAARMRLDQKNAEFATAMKTRAAEIAQEKGHMEGVLKN